MTSLRCLYRNVTFDVQRSIVFGMMGMVESKEFFPVEVVFHPDWWNKRFGMDFGWDYFFDPVVRVKVEQRMGRILYEKFGQFGYGDKEPKEEPVIGAVHLAAGFLVSAICGCDVKYYPDASPQVICRNMAIEEFAEASQPEPGESKEFKALVKLIETLKEKYGYVKGDINWSGVQNLALDVLGQDLFIAYMDRAELVDRVFDKLTDVVLDFVNYIRGLTGTSSISVNRSIIHVDSAINLSSNCSVQMISNQQYERFLLGCEKRLAKELQPYGIHHCGDNMHAVAEGYSKVGGCCFFDVGWGADIEYCRRLLPEAFFNIRLSPVRIREQRPDEVTRDVEKVLKAAGDLSRVGLCCINMDSDTPDENVAAIFETAQRYRRIGG